MTKSDFFSDSIYQLELNLHNKQRELILMLEEFKKQDCPVCLQLKCRCIQSVDEKEAAINNQHDSDNELKDNAPNKAPPADSLPKPKFKHEALNISTKDSNGIESWIDTSAALLNAGNPDRRTSTDVLASLKRCWAERTDVKMGRNLEDYKTETAILDRGYAAANAVEVFFNSFKAQSVNTANVSIVDKTAATYASYKRSSEYSHF